VVFGVDVVGIIDVEELDTEEEEAAAAKEDVLGRGGRHLIEKGCRHKDCALQRESEQKDEEDASLGACSVEVIGQKRLGNAQRQQDTHEKHRPSEVRGHRHNKYANHPHDKLCASHGHDEVGVLSGQVAIRIGLCQPVTQRHPQMQKEMQHGHKRRHHHYPRRILAVKRL